MNAGKRLSFSIAPTFRHIESVCQCGDCAEKRKVERECAPLADDDSRRDWAARPGGAIAAAQRARIMRGVDMPGRIVDDVDPASR